MSETLPQPEINGRPEEELAGEWLRAAALHLIVQAAPADEQKFLDITGRGGWREVKPAARARLRKLAVEYQLMAESIGWEYSELYDPEGKVMEIFKPLTSGEVAAYAELARERSAALAVGPEDDILPRQLQDRLPRPVRFRPKSVR